MFETILNLKNMPIESFGDVLVFGGTIALIGIATVFAVLAVLWLSLLAFKFFFHDLPAKKKSESANEATPAPVVEVESASNDDEIVAVIAAAIATAESESDGVKFRVVSFRRT